MNAAQTLSAPSSFALKPFLIRLAAAASNLYGLALCLYLAARLLGGRLAFIAELGSNFMPLALLVALPPLLIWVLARKWLTAGLLMPALVFFLVSYGDLLLPNAAVPAGAPLRLLTHNLHGMTDNLEPVHAIIRDANADIVALQELTDAAAADLIQTFGDAYPYRHLFTIGESVVGMGILSRLPLGDADYWEHGLGNIRTSFTFGETSVTFYNVHPPPPSVFRGFDASGRHAAIDLLIERLESEDGVLLLAGDFNMADQTDDYARLTGRFALRDAFRVAGVGLGPTFPNMGYASRALGYVPPFVRIDYVFFSAPFQAADARVWTTSGGSDHYPVLATLVLPD